MEIFIGVAGLLIAWLTYVKTFHSKPDEEKLNFLGVFLTTQQLHLEVQGLMQKYIDENDGAEHFLYTNITFQQMLDIYKETFEKELSDKVFQDFKDNKDLSKSNFATLQNMIDTQHNNLLLFRNQLLFIIPRDKKLETN